MDLDATEIRVLGCLLEKQRTTPDAYPLSINSLRLACNQATNRDPVVQYDEATVRAALHRLGRRRWTRLASGGRTAKYRHLLDDALPLDRGEQAVLCLLMLRGPQTPGELKQRSERMHVFGDLAALRLTLDRLIGRGLVRRLDRRPGHKEERYLQLLGDPDAEPTSSSSVVEGVSGSTRSWEGDRTANPPASQPDPDGLGGPPGGPSRVFAVGGPGQGAPGSEESAASDETQVRPADIAPLVARVERLERDLAALREALGE